MRRVAVLGTGIMGAGMARSLLRASLDVIVWNRSPGRAASRASRPAGQIFGYAAQELGSRLLDRTSNLARVSRSSYSGPRATELVKIAKPFPGRSLVQAASWSGGLGAAR